MAVTNMKSQSFGSAIFLWIFLRLGALPKLAKALSTSHLNIMEEPFDFTAPAEVYTAKRNSSRAQPVTYKRFSAGSEAVQYVMESLQADKLSCTVIEAGDERYDGRAIQALYDSPEYPLARAKT